MKQTLYFLTLIIVISACTKKTDETASPTLKVTLIAPSNGSTVLTTKSTQFSWSSSASNATVPVLHKITIVEITGDQSPEIALRTNKPIFEKDSMKELSFQFPLTAMSPGFKIDTKYAWQVLASQKALANLTASSTNSSFTTTR
jgi:hypothetical protein